MHVGEAENTVEYDEDNYDQGEVGAASTSTQ